MNTSPYQMCINNIAREIRIQSRKTPKDEENLLSAFTASIVLGLAFCKAKEEVLADLLNAEVDP